MSDIYDFGGLEIRTVYFIRDIYWLPLAYLVAL